MPKEESVSKKVIIKKYGGGGAGGAVYGLGFIGALIHYWMHAPNFWAGVVGLLKAIVWPAFLVFRVFELLKP